MRLYIVLEEMYFTSLSNLVNLKFLSDIVANANCDVKACILLHSTVLSEFSHLIIYLNERRETNFWNCFY